MVEILRCTPCNKSGKLIQKKLRIQVIGDLVNLTSRSEQRMEVPQRAIGVFTSGGDAPGMNAALRAMVAVANSKGKAFRWKEQKGE